MVNLSCCGYCIAGIFLFHLVAIKASSNETSVTSRIVGGTITSINKTPYIMKIRLDGRFFCGGSLLAPLYVVSAAHCYERVSEKRLLVVGGATKLSEPGVKRKVARIIRNRNYNPTTYAYDVAVLKLTAAMTGTNIETISLYTGALNPGMMVKVSGWGLTRENANTVSNSLRTMQVPVIAKTKCQFSYRGQMRITDTMFCASTPGKKDSCQGDSGGPAVCNGKLCGIVSWGFGCARANYPGVYTNTNAVRNFIIDCMKQ